MIFLFLNIHCLRKPISRYSLDWRLFVCWSTVWIFCFSCPMVFQACRWNSYKFGRRICANHSWIDRDPAAVLSVLKCPTLKPIKWSSLSPRAFWSASLDLPLPWANSIRPSSAPKTKVSLSFRPQGLTIEQMEKALEVVRDVCLKKAKITIGISLKTVLKPVLNEN